MGKTKYLFYVPSFYPCGIGGLEIATYYLVKYFAERRNILIMSSCKAVSLNCEVVLIKRNIFMIKRFGLGRLSEILSTLYSLIKYKDNILKIFIPHTSYCYHYGLIFPLMKLIFKIEYSLHCHGGGVKKWHYFSPNKLLFKYAQNIFAVSESIRSEFSKRTQREINLILPMVPFISTKESKKDVRKKMGIDVDAKIILMVGSLKTIKGNDILLSAFLNIDLRVIKEKKLYLYFCGDGDMRSKLQNKIKAHKEYSEFIKFAGKIPFEEIHSYYCISDIYVIASHFEGTPLSLLEAMANSLPIIASDAKGINTIIQNNKNGYLFKINDYKELRDRIIKCINNEHETKSLGEQAKKTYESRYNFVSEMKKIEELFL